MTLLAPFFFWGAVAVSAGIVALHFIVTRQPRAVVLPTARFVPDSPATAAARDARPADLLLLLLRVLVVLATGAGLARPILQPSKRPEARVILADASRAASSVQAVRDSVGALFRDGDAVVVFDSTAPFPGITRRDSIGVLRGPNVVGNLSAALISAFRAGSALRDKVDSVELVIVSPLLAEEWDAATDSIRKLWPGRARVVRVQARADSSLTADQGDIAIRADATDPLGVTVSLAARRQRHQLARIVRSATLTPDDSGWVATGSRVLALWPVQERPRFAVRLNPPDESGGLIAYDVRVVSAFDRKWKFSTDSLQDGRVVARWVDGEPAVVEKPLGQGCLRSVAIPVARAGDLVLRPEFVKLLEAITAPCGEPFSRDFVGAPRLAWLAGTGGLAPADAFATRQDIDSPLSPWLFGLALAAALTELVVRRRGDKQTVRDVWWTSGSERDPRRGAARNEGRAMMES
jgi:hypothetical protein